jgi:hypothetical protein
MTNKKPVDKYIGTKPLFKTVNNNYPENCVIEYIWLQGSNQFDLYEAMRGKKLADKNYNIEFSTNAMPQDLDKLEFLWCLTGPAFVVHKRVVDKLNELCPNDIQVFPVTIKNFDESAPKFVNKNYYLINILKLVDVFDKSYLITEGRIMPKLSKQVFNDNCMQGALLARDNIFHSCIFFHPSLAKHFSQSQDIQFFTEDEAPL